MQRYAREIVAALDARLADDPPGARVTLLLPPDAVDPPALRHIEPRRAGRRRGHRWEQLDLPRHVDTGVLVSLGNTGPLRVRRQVVVIHDASVFTMPATYTFAFRTWYRFLLRRLARRCAGVATVSDFSRREIARCCGVSADHLRIAPPSAAHIARPAADPSLLEAHGLAGRPYLLTVGGTARHKNVGAVVDALARLGPGERTLAIVGAPASGVFRGDAPSGRADVVETGRCTDAQLRALYEHATCLVFPSLYEGFGIPPLEAMTCGCPVLTARTASMPEVCGDAALYFDPRDPGAIAECVRELENDPSLRARLIERGRARAATFDIRDSAATLWSMAQAAAAGCRIGAQGLRD